MKLDEAVDIKYNGITVKQVYCNNTLIWPQNIIDYNLFWNFIANPSGKTLTAFNIEFQGGQITADWGDGSSQVLTSSVNYNHTFI